MDPRLAAATEPNWDGYNGLPTTGDAIITAECVVWTPRADGGLMMEIERDDVSVSIDIDGGGRIISISFDRS